MAYIPGIRVAKKSAAGIVFVQRKSICLQEHDPMGSVEQKISASC